MSSIHIQELSNYREKLIVNYSKPLQDQTVVNNTKVFMVKRHNLIQYFSRFPVVTLSIADKPMHPRDTLMYLGTVSVGNKESKNLLVEKVYVHVNSELSIYYLDETYGAVGYYRKVTLVELLNSIFNRLISTTVIQADAKTELKLQGY